MSAAASRARLPGRGARAVCAPRVMPGLHRHPQAHQRVVAKAGDAQVMGDLDAALGLGRQPGGDVKRRP